MARIAYILLCHKAPDEIIARTRMLISAGDAVSIHFDKSAGVEGYERLRAAFTDEPSVTFAKRHRCGWGQWSLVAATLSALSAARKAFRQITHYYLVSGDCMPIKPAEFGHDMLARDDRDFIEAVDFFTSGWIRTGMTEERLIYYHPFNERSQKKLFYAGMALQKRLKLRRQLPKDLTIHIGSQWWCLRAKTIEAIFDYIEERPELIWFFRHTWVPDEIFFQTLVAHLIPRNEIATGSPTFLLFSDYGLPVTIYNDHYDLLLGQNALFARKLSPEASELKTRLTALYKQPLREISVSDEGKSAYRFLANNGRSGKRYAPRIWDRDAQQDRPLELLIITCKKWHVAQRLADRIGRETNMHSTGYLFDEEVSGLPALGGLSHGKFKRLQNPLAYLRLLAEHFDSQSLIFCLDPAQLKLLEALAGNGCDLRILEIECALSDEYLTGHAERLGLLSENSAPQVINSIIPALRRTISQEFSALRRAGFTRYERITEFDSSSTNTQVLAGFSKTGLDIAQNILNTSNLFQD